MKINNLYIALLLFSALVFHACYEDKGNYDYTERLEVGVSNIEENYSKLVLDTLKLNPVITPADREYDCFWCILPDGGNMTKLDTIAKTKELNYIINLQPGTYKLWFSATDRATGVFNINEYTLSIKTDMAIGWWVLKENEGITDIDLIAPDRVLDNMLSKGGHVMKGEPKNLFYYNDYRLLNDETHKTKVTKAVFAASDNDVVVMDFYSGKVLRSFDDVFFNSPTTRKVQNVFRTKNGAFVVNDNKMYPMIFTGSRRFGFFGDALVGAEKQISDYKMSQKNTEYPIMFDEKSSSFFYANAITSWEYIELTNNSWVSGAEDKSLATNLNADLLYMGTKLDEYLMMDRVYALMKAKDADEYRLLNMKGSLYVRDVPKIPVYTTTVLDKNLNVLKADMRAMAKSYNLMFFYKDNKFWTFDVDSHNEVALDVTVPNGEKITYMENLCFQPDDTDLWFDALIVGTESAGNYKLYKYDIKAGKLQPATLIGSGKGKVHRCIYLYTDTSVNETQLY